MTAPLANQIVLGDCLDVMRALSEIQIGKAGVHLVCADLIMRGYIAYIAEEGLPYDIVVDIEGKLVKVQVKTTIEPKKNAQNKHWTPYYRFNYKRKGKRGRNSYNKGEVDLFALVALDSKAIGYITNDQMKKSMSLRSSQFKGQYYGERLAGLKQEVKQLRMRNKSFTEIGDTLKIDRAFAHRIWCGKDRKNIGGIYLDELTLEKALDVLGR